MYMKVINKVFLEDLITMKYLSDKWTLISHEKGSPIYEFREESQDFKCVVNIEDETVSILPIYLVSYDDDFMHVANSSEKKSILVTIEDFIMEWFNAIGVLVFLMLILVLCDRFIAPMLNKG